MSNLHALTDTQTILLAAQFISDVDVESLQTIAAERKDVLTRDIIYRLLLTLYPTDDTARSALLALLKNIHNDGADTSSLDHRVDTSSVAKLPLDVLRRHAEQLHLQSLGGKDAGDAENALEDFIISWIHRLESTEGSIEQTLPLIDAFSSDYPSLHLWCQTYLVPIIRLRYDFYPDVQDVISVQELESVSGITGVRALLRCAEQQSRHAFIARDLEEVVAPWITGSGDFKRRRLNNSNPNGISTSWSDVNEWILSTSLKDFPLASKALIEWDGPQCHAGESTDDGDGLAQSEYAQAGLAAIFANLDTSEDTTTISKLILQRVATRLRLEIVDLSDPKPDVGQAAGSLVDVSEADLLFNSLLRRKNELTRPSQGSLAFMAGTIHSTDVLRELKIFSSFSDIAKICLSSSEERQKQELQRILQQIPRLTSAAPDWRYVRDQLLWLRSWRPKSDAAVAEEHPSPTRAYLSHVDLDHLEAEILNSIIAGGQYNAAKELYIDSRPRPLQLSGVESRVVTSIYSAYDNASNGNKNRGGMKRAYEILTAFKPNFPRSESLRDIDHLIKATHSLSFYPLTLHHGIPFQPVNIRAHKDPLSLVGKVLEQDQKAYTKLDDLLEIGRNLVQARLPSTSMTSEDQVDVNQRLLDAERRITYLAITSALAAHDFDTAYSYITTRLTMSPVQASTDSVDDISWRAAYAAGKYRPSSSPKSLHSQIASLSKRMDLLSLALTLAPGPDPLSEILGTWRRCEEEMDNLKSQALEEERTFDAHGGTSVPGGFGLEDREIDAAETKQAMARRSLAGSSATYEEEAPVGLFDVARGAASALRKSAFPLRAASMNEFTIQKSPSRQASSMSGMPSPTIVDGGGRTRKRDIVSGMVTGGLVSGMSWVLGAQPVEKEAHDEEV